MFHGRAVPLAISLLVAHGASGQNVPAAIAPPSASKLVSSATATGVQIYACTAKGGAAAWVLKAPEADLVDARGKSFAKHFAGPSWQAPDGSKVTGTLLAKAASPDRGAIPWLLLSGKPSGTGVLGKIRFVQRTETKGGLPPAGACVAGRDVRVPYTARYGFFE